MLFRVIISFKLFLLKWKWVIYKYSCPSRKRRNTGVLLDENQSLCTTKHTGSYIHCIQTDTAAINSHTNTHSLILTPSFFCLFLSFSVSRLLMWPDMGSVPTKFNLPSNSISKTWSKLCVCWARHKQARTQSQRGSSRNLIIAVPSSNRFVLNWWVVLIDFS